MNTLTHNKQERLHWIDIAKGLLIISVIVYHIPEFADQNHVKGLKWMYCLRPLFQAYFMPAFFIITGFCSSFQGESNLHYVWKNFKQLMIPNFLITILIPFCSHILNAETNLYVYYGYIVDFFSTGGYWFLTSLFLVKIFYKLIKYYIYSTKIQCLIIIILFLLGIIFANYRIKNIFFYENSLILIFFLWIGDFIKSRKDVNLRKYIFIPTVLYIFTIFLLKIFAIDMPFVTLHISISLMAIPLFFILSLSGSLVILGFSYTLGKSFVLEYLGRISLSIYLFHMYFLLKILPHLSFFHVNLYGGICEGILLVFLTLIFCVIMDAIFNTKYLKWTLGKF